MLKHTAVQLRQVLVLGAGTMGSGIAQVASAAGHKVHLVDLSEDILSKGIQRMERSMNKYIAKKFKEEPNVGKDYKAKVLSGVETTTDALAAASTSDIIIETITEDLEEKKKMWAKLDSVAPEKVLFASNTSSLSIGTLSVATARPHLFGGLHFFAPVPKMKLVEVIKSEHTSHETVDGLLQFVKELGKVPITCKDSRGFVVNRLLIPLILEAIRMVQRGDATIDDIDTAMKLGAGHPMGPLELSDLIGNDVLNMIVSGWHKIEPDQPFFDPPTLLEAMIRDGKLGEKSGEGFYKKHS